MPSHKSGTSLLKQQIQEHVMCSWCVLRILPHLCEWEYKIHYFDPLQRKYFIITVILITNDYSSPAFRFKNQLNAIVDSGSKVIADKFTEWKPLPS